MCLELHHGFHLRQVLSEVYGDFDLVVRWRRERQKGGGLRRVLLPSPRAIPDRGGPSVSAQRHKIRGGSKLDGLDHV